MEVPNKTYKQSLSARDNRLAGVKNAPSKLTFAIGKNISGEAIVGNIASFRICSWPVPPAHGKVGMPQFADFKYPL